MTFPPPSQDPEAVRDLADQILAGSRYDQPSPPLPERIQQWFADRIADVLGGLVGSGAGAVLAWLLLTGLIAGIAYLAIRHGRVPRLGRPVGAPVAEPMVELTRSPAEWLTEAARLEATGRWAEGLRCRHRALVAELVASGVISDQPGRTAGEHLSDVRERRPDAAPAMAAATELFEAAWYGGARTAEAEAIRFQQLAAAVLAVRPAPSGASR